MLRARLLSENEEVLEMEMESKEISIEVKNVSKAMDIMSLFSEFKSSILDALKERGFEIKVKKSFLEFEL